MPTTTDFANTKLLTNDVHIETGVVERGQVYVRHSMSEQVHLATIIYNKEAQASTGYRIAGNIGGH